MIENTWKWAKENNKIIKHPISGGEFVDIDVEHAMKKVHETGARMSQEAAGHYQDNTHACCDILFAKTPCMGHQHNMSMSMHIVAG